MTIPLVSWRETLVSQDMVAPLDELSASVPPIVKPIKGYGSYRDNAASGGTDNGSGHVDIYANTAGWTDEHRKTFVANGREMGFSIFERPPKWYSPIRDRWLEADWAWHFHLILKDSADLSDGAKKQLSQWYDGSNGLAGFWWNGVYRYDPDPGPRKYLRQTWQQYLTLKEEQDMQLTDPVKVSDWCADLLGRPRGSEVSVSGLLQYGAMSLFTTQKYVRPELAAQAQAIAEIKGQFAGQAEMLKQIQADGDVTDLDAVVVAAREAARLGAVEGASAALDQLVEAADVDVNFVVNPT